MGKHRPGGRTRWGKTISDEQALEVMEWLDKQRKHRARWDELDEKLGYSPKSSMAFRIHSGERRPSSKAYERFKSIVAAREGERYVPAPEPHETFDEHVRAHAKPFKPMSKSETRETRERRGGILSDLEHARNSLDTAIADIERASTTSVPLLRPGLRELAGQLRTSRKMLEMS